jgi:hypothetical protein
LESIDGIGSVFQGMGTIGSRGKNTKVGMVLIDMVMVQPMFIHDDPYRHGSVIGSRVAVRSALLLVALRHLVGHLEKPVRLAAIRLTVTAAGGGDGAVTLGLCCWSCWQSSHAMATS